MDTFPAGALTPTTPRSPRLRGSPHLVVHIRQPPTGAVTLAGSGGGCWRRRSHLQPRFRVQWGRLTCGGARSKPTAAASLTGIIDGNAGSVRLASSEGHL